jgi:hypothetical protein
VREVGDGKMTVAWKSGRTTDFVRGEAPVDLPTDFPTEVPGN